MIQPEEDFQTWILIASSTIDDPEQFVCFIPDIERLINSIIETGNLPSPIESETDNFILKLNTEIEMKTLTITALSENLIQDYRDLYFKILDFGKYGTDIDKDTIVYCAFTIISHIEASIYKISDDFNGAVIADYAFQIDLYNSIYSKIINVPPTLRLLVIYYQIIDELRINDENFDLINFSTSIANASLKISKENPRLNTKQISFMYTRILTDAINAQCNPHEFCDPWLELFIFFLKGEIFEKQLFALQQIQILLYDPLLSTGALSFFTTDGESSVDGEESTPLKIFEEMKTIHPELCGPISEILTKLAEYGLVSDSLILHLWKLHSVQHSSDLSKFFVIFSSMATTLPPDQLHALVSMCINPDRGCETEEWIKFLKVLAENIGMRDVENDSFSIVRDKLIEIALSNEKPANIVKAARDVLPSIIGIQADKGAFYQIAHQLTSLLKEALEQKTTDDFDNLIFLFRLLSAALCSIQFDGMEQAEDLLKKSILFVQEKLPIVQNEEEDINAVSRDIVMNFISSLCYNNVLKISNEELDILFNYRHTMSFHNIISRMVMKNLIPIDHLTSLIEGLKTEEIDDPLFNLARDITYVMNNLTSNSSYVSFPLINENLLWDLSLIDSVERTKFAQFLCQLYSRNDGIRLTDYQMMSAFIQKWITYFDQAKESSKNGDNRKALISLLRHFIMEIESQQDIQTLGIHRHTTCMHPKIVHVDIAGKVLPNDLHYDLPDSTLVYVLRQRVSKVLMIPTSTILFYRFTKKVPNAISLRQLAGNYEKVSLTVQVLQNMKQEAVRDTRDILPSQLIIQNYPETFNMLMSLLKEKDETAPANNIDGLIYNFTKNSINAEVKLLLNYLPTNFGTLMQIREMKKCKSFDYQSFFPLEHQNLFLYNFESFLEVFNEEQEKSTNGKNDNKENKRKQKIYGEFENQKEKQEEKEDEIHNSLKFHFIRTGGFLYVIQAIPKITSIQLNHGLFLFLEKILDKEITEKYGQIVFDTLFPYIAEISKNKNELIQFTILSSFLRNVFKPRGDLETEEKVKLNLTDDFLDKIMKPLMFSPTENVRYSTPDLLSNIPIPLSMFIQIIDEINEEIAPTFYNTLYQHINLESIEQTNSEDMRKLVKVIRKLVLVQPNYLSTVLAILDNLLEIENDHDSINIFDEKDKLFITESLVDRYLKPDPRDKEKAVFTFAVRCLSKMQNDFLLKHLEFLHYGRSMYSDWDIDGDSNIISPNGHCGLVNLGATCFLNSILQQFFAIAILRNAIISYVGRNDFMTQLKILFTQMYLSKGQLINPSKLVDVWTGWDGEPMNPLIQQDALEFAQMLVDKLEGGLSPAFMNHIFAGTTIDKFIGLSEEYESQQSQPFTSFTLPIQGSTNVFDALSKLQDPNFLTGANQYFAESLNKKIDAKKVSMFGKLPQILILQLSRFEYNYQEGYRTKINSVFTFPSKLDLAPYTNTIQDGETKQETRYELRGVVMHQGTAVFGHYTSYIKDIETNKWFLYNDQTVTEVEEAEVLLKGSGKESKNLSGYILFYDRVDTLDQSRKLNSTRPKISNVLVQEIEKENRMKDEYRLFCSEPYFDFMTLLATTKIKTNTDLDFNPRFVGIAIQYYFDTFPFTLHVKRAEELVPPICEKLRKSRELSSWFTQYIAEGPFHCSLVYCPTRQVRIGVIEMVKSIKIDTVPKMFLSRLIDSIRSVTPYYLVFDESFLLIDYFLSHSNSMFNFCAKSKLFNYCINLLARNIPDYIQKSGMTDDDFFMGVNLTGLLHIFSRYYLFYHKKPLQLSFSNIEESEEEKENVNHDQLIESLDAIDIRQMNALIRYILSDDVLQNLLRSKTEVSAITLLLKSFDDQQELVRSQLINFAEKCGIYVNYHTIVNLLFNYFEMKAIPLILHCHFMIENRSTNAFDLALSIYNLFKQDSFVKPILLQEADQWIYKLVTDDLYECRIATEHAVSVLVPDQIFMNSFQRKHLTEFKLNENESIIPPLSEMPMNECISSAEMIEFNPIKRDGQIIDNANYILKSLLSHKKEFICLITSNKASNVALSGQSSTSSVNAAMNYNDFSVNENATNSQSFLQIQAKQHFRVFLGVQYIDLIDRLSAFCDVNITNDLIEIASELIKTKQQNNQTEMFDGHLSRICVALKRSLRIYKYTDDFDFNKFFLAFFPHPKLESPLIQMRASINPNISNSTYSTSVALNFFKDMEGVIEDGKFPDEFIISFIKFYAFTEAAISNKLYKVFCSYIRSFAKTNPELVYNCIKEGLNRYAVVCFSGVLIALDFLNKDEINYRLPLLNFLWHSINKREIFTLNEMVVKAFEYSMPADGGSAEIAIDYNKLVSILSLLNSSDLLPDAREWIWKLVFSQQAMIPFTAFNYIYKYKGDWDKVARFIVVKFEGKNKDNIQQPEQMPDENNFVVAGNTINSAVELAIEASMNSLEAFSILLDFLIEFDPNTLFNKFDFAQSILSQHIDSNSAKIIIHYIKLFSSTAAIQTGQNDKNEIVGKLMEHLANAFKIRAHFLLDAFNEILEVGDDSYFSQKSLNGNDLCGIIGLLTVINEFKPAKDLVLQQVEQLKKACGNNKILKMSEEIPELSNLKKMIDNF